jgi:cation diffusion facilitator CzcD-associated flavoprotein CzcO
MLQRSPTYFVSGRNANDLADTLRELEIPEEWVHEIVRRKILKDQATIARRAFTEPEVLRKELLAGVRAHLPPDFDVDKHFTPRYQPWRQRIAFVPDGDLFRCVREGKASVATDEIETFTEAGIQLKSGEVLEADVVVTATGFNLNVLGDVGFSIDGRPLDFSSTVGWHGTMFTGVPNMAWVFGYFRASWTLRADLISDFVCRLLAHMDELGVRQVTPRLRPEDEGMPLKPWFDLDNFNPGYVLRGAHLMPKQGDRLPWRHTQDYWSDRGDLPAADLDDGTLAYE